MEMKDVFKRYLVFVIGLYFLAAGIVLIVRSALGTTPISSVNYVLSLNSPSMQHLLFLQILCQLCIKSEQSLVIRDLYISHQYAAYYGTVLVNQKK